MSLTKFTKDVANISLLSDYPNSTEGLTAQELKERHDKAGIDIKEFINETLTSELDAIHTNYDETLATKEEIDNDYLKKTDAEATYLTIDDASTTYLTQADADSDYLKKVDASSTYLTQTDAQNTYDTISNVSSTYATKQALAEAQMGAIVDQSVTREKLALELQDSLSSLEEKETYMPSNASVENKFTTNEDLENVRENLEIEISNIGDNLATVATTGSYNDLIDKPFIPVIPTNVGVLKVNEIELANKTLTITDTVDTSKTYNVVFNGEGKIIVELPPSNYDLKYMELPTVWKTNINVIGGLEVTATLVEEEFDAATLILGFDIDETIASPNDRVTYTDDMLNFDKDWVFDNVPALRDIRPCRLNNVGQVTAYLQKMISQKM